MDQPTPQKMVLLGSYKYSADKEIPALLSSEFHQCSRKHATRNVSQIQSTSYLISPRPILILFSHLHINVPCFLTKMLRTSHFCVCYVGLPSNLDSTTLTIIDESARCETPQYVTIPISLECYLLQILTYSLACFQASSMSSSIKVTYQD
jgi:hypothetical protein